MQKRDKINVTPAAVAALAMGDLHNAAMAMVPGGIEAQEAAGQAMLMASQQLPHPGRDRELFEALGFVFGSPIDELFVSATLPPGWTKKASEHSMNSGIFDEQGRERANVFYKAAFYDRRADMTLYPRYRFRAYEPVDGSPDMNAVRLLDYDGSVVREFGTCERHDYKARTKLEDEARRQIAKEFPEWRNPLAYWD